MIPSLPKLIGLICIIWVVWITFRFFETRHAASREPGGKNNNEKDPTDHDADQGEHTDRGSVELCECKICSAWVSGENCGLENCPY